MTALNPTSPWSATGDLTARNTEIIRRARDEKQAPSAIAREMGLTKNQVAGVMYRDGVVSGGFETDQALAAAIGSRKAAEKRAALEAMGPRKPTCQWVTKAATWGCGAEFCGGEVRSGKPYCHIHAAAAYAPARPR